jgi:predicted DNA-binding transcriptional regulator AlpA
MARYGVSRMWLERHIKDHGFPHPIKFGGPVGAVRHFRRSAVLAWEVQWEEKNLNELVRSARPHQGAHDPVREQLRQSAEEVK